MITYATQFQLNRKKPHYIEPEMTPKRPQTVCSANRR